MIRRHRDILIAIYIGACAAAGLVIGLTIGLTS